MPICILDVVKGRFPLLATIACAFFGCVAVAVACIIFPHQDGLVIDVNTGRVAGYSRALWQAPQIRGIIETEFSKGYLKYVGPYPAKPDWRSMGGFWWGGLPQLCELLESRNPVQVEVSPDMLSALETVAQWMESGDQQKYWGPPRGFTDAGKGKMILTVLELLRKQPFNPTVPGRHSDMATEYPSVVTPWLLGSRLMDINHPVDASDVPSADEYIREFRGWNKPRGAK